MLQFVLTAPPQNHEPSISSTISLPICEPLSISPTSYRNSPMGPPPFISFHDIYASPRAFINHWGTRFCILYIFPTFIILLYKHLLLPTFVFVIPVGDLLPFFGHTQPMSPLVGVSLLIFPHRHRLCLQSTTQVIYHLSSEFTYLVPPLAQLTSDLVVPMTLDLVPTVAATPSIMHPPTKGSLESSHFLTSSMSLCLPLTSVDSTEYLLLLGVASPFCRHQHTFPKRRQYLGPHFPF
jgi:hypothetical protein